MIVIETKHIERTPQYDIVVNKLNDDTFCLLFLSKVVQTGNGKILTTYPNAEWAIEAAKKFPKMYIIAQELGYTLYGAEFVNKDGRRIHVSLALDSDRSEFEFKSMLR